MNLDNSAMNVFVNSAKTYFASQSNVDCLVGAPYLVEQPELPNYDFTGVVSISGPQKGVVYFTAPKILLRHLLLCLGEDDKNQPLQMDLVGELANIFSGNARSVFGSSFAISVPQVLTGKISPIELENSKHAYVIPINWKGYTANIVVYLES